MPTFELENYRVRAVLSEGGFTTTVAAEAADGTAVVIKRFSLREAVARRRSGATISLTEPDVFKLKELFEREASALRNLSHRGIPRLVDFITRESADDLELFIVQQHVVGGNLAEQVRGGTHFDERQIVDIALDAAGILAYLHSLRPPIVHRDIKPSNLIRSDDGALFLVDFDAIKHDVGKQLLGDATVVGTFGYMPMEQFHGQATPASDVYALGGTLVFLLTHRLPADLPRRGLRPDFRKGNQVSKPLAALLDRMLSPEPRKRPADGAALIEALERVRAGQAPLATKERPRAPKAGNERAHKQPRARRPKQALSPTTVARPSFWLPALTVIVAGASFITFAIREAMGTVEDAPAEQRTAPSSINGCYVEPQPWRPEPHELAQRDIRWATSVVTSSDSTRATRDVLGAPNATREGFSVRGAWVPPAGGESWVTLRFPLQSGETALALVVAEARAVGGLKRVERMWDSHDCVLWSGRLSDPHGGSRMLRFDFPGPISPGDISLVFDGTGNTSDSNPLDAVGLIVREPEVPLRARERVASSAREWRYVETERPRTLGDVAWTSRVLARDQKHADDGTYMSLVGAPDVWPEHRNESGNAWSPRQHPFGKRWVAVSFGERPVRARAVVLAESYKPGAVVRVDDISAEVANGQALDRLDDPALLWEGVLPLEGINPRYTCHAERSRILWIDLPEPREISAVRVMLDTTLGCYSELDAIGLMKAE